MARLRVKFKTRITDFEYVSSMFNHTEVDVEIVTKISY